MKVRILMAVLAAASWLCGQGAAPRPMTDQEATAAYERALQLMEAGGVASPELGRAGVPLEENMRQALDSLKFLGPRQTQLHYKMLRNLQAYLLVADAVPKPENFPEAARRQLEELRSLSARIESYMVAQMEQMPRLLANPDRDNLARYHDANLSMAAPAAGNPRVVFLGDSITDGWRLNEYFPGKDFVNRGISGQTTGQMLGRFQADVARLKPAAVVILAGTNDIARGVDPQAIEDNLTMITTLAEVSKIKVFVSSILPVSDHHKDANPQFERTRQRPLAAILDMNRRLQQLCERKGYTYINYFPALSDPKGQLAPNLADDGLHPNPTGYRVMAPILLAALEKQGAAAQPATKKRRLF
jgi:lysophospholipase L1-like esterase